MSIKADTTELGVYEIMRIIDSKPNDLEKQLGQILKDMEKAAAIDTIITMLENLYYHDKGQLMKDMVEMFLLRKIGIEGIGGTPSRATVLRGFWDVLHKTFEGDIDKLMQTCRELQEAENS